MKKTLLTLIIAFVSVVGFTDRSLAQSSGYTFQVSNQQSESLGNITISTSAGDPYLSVPGNSNDTLPISDTANSVTINGQTVPQGVRAVLQLPSGKFVILMWTAQDAIVVIDDDILGSIYNIKKYSYLT